MLGGKCDVSGIDNGSGEILGRPGMHHPAALRYRSRGRYFQSGATFLRSLGPEPWNVAYVEPSRRPTDGRYGENPNRLQHYYQYQVVMKPSPLKIQELYLESLRAFGIDPLEHDIRFVKDDWESPTLGEHGGWAGKSGWMAWR